MIPGQDIQDDTGKNTEDADDEEDGTQDSRACGKLAGPGKRFQYADPGEQSQ